MQKPFPSQLFIAKLVRNLLRIKLCSSGDQDLQQLLFRARILISNSVGDVIEQFSRENSNYSFSSNSCTSLLFFDNQELLIVDPIVRQDSCKIQRQFELIITVLIFF